jgi:Zn-dependent peptidase ImmA (M78 family)
LLGDVLFTGARTQAWYVSSDIPTERQKIQRAFAAEFLCPAEGALEQLGGDYSEPAVEQVAEHFDVSTEIVAKLIANQEVNR